MSDLGYNLCTIWYLAIFSRNSIFLRELILNDGSIFNARARFLPVFQNSDFRNCRELGNMEAIATFDFRASHQDELSFKQGDVLKVLQNQQVVYFFSILFLEIHCSNIYSGRTMVSSRVQWIYWLCTEKSTSTDRKQSTNRTFS